MLGAGKDCPGWPKEMLCPSALFSADAHLWKLLLIHLSAHYTHTKLRLLWTTSTFYTKSFIKLL